jgi:hypothetical protein
MTTKELAYSIQYQLEAKTGATFKRTHVHELLAASFGFNSHAALCVGAVLSATTIPGRRLPDHLDQLGRRCLDLGYPPEVALKVTHVLPASLAEQNLGAIRIDDLVACLRRVTGRADALETDVENDDGGVGETELEVDALSSSILLEGLSSAAVKGSAEAHYALALLHSPSDDDFDAPEVGADYWYNEAKRGRILSGIELEWANAHAARLARKASYEQHLREAGRLGHQHALFELAERFGDTSFFDRADHPLDVDPVRVAEVAEALERRDDARRWLAVAAKQGDVEAMRRLIEEYDRDDLQQCWTWFYLADLLGTDLSEDEHEAINEDGSPYDDDVGGPVYLGGVDGVELEPMSPERDAAARRRAAELYETMQEP